MHHRVLLDPQRKWALIKYLLVGPVVSRPCPAGAEGSGSSAAVYYFSVVARPRGGCPAEATAQGTCELWGRPENLGPRACRAGSKVPGRAAKKMACKTKDRLWVLALRQLAPGMFPHSGEERLLWRAYTCEKTPVSGALASPARGEHPCGERTAPWTVKTLLSLCGPLCLFSTSTP